MEKKESETEIRQNAIISAICGLFSHEKANSMLTKSFTECNDIHHKTDCMKTILEKAREKPTIFFSKLNAIIRLHSNILKEKEELLDSLNQELKLISLKYNLELLRLEALEGFEPYLITKRLLEVDRELIADEFYKNLITEINWCYGTGANSATMVMIRKLFENLIKDLLRKKYKSDPKKVKFYWKEKGFISFNEMINNLEKNINDFKHYSKKIDSELIKFIREIKYIGNESSHTIEDSISIEKIEEIKKSVNYYLKLLLRVIK